MEEVTGVNLKTRILCGVRLNDRQMANAYHQIKTREDINLSRNIRAQGNYPLGMSDCFVVGINGDCGPTCPVLLTGGCDCQEDFITPITQTEPPQ